MLLIYDLMFGDVLNSLFTFLWWLFMEPKWSYLIVSCLVAEKELEGRWRIK